MIIAVDFDRTLCGELYQEGGKLNVQLIDALVKRRKITADLYMLKTRIKRSAYLCSIV